MLTVPTVRAKTCAASPTRTCISNDKENETSYWQDQPSLMITVMMIMRMMMSIMMMLLMMMMMIMNLRLCSCASHSSRAPRLFGEGSADMAQAREAYTGMALPATLPGVVD